MWSLFSSPPRSAHPSRISAEFQEKVRSLEIGLNQRADSLLRGDRLAGLPGRGMEVGGVREYHPGDEARGIDWRVTARTGRLHVKEFEEERDLSSLVVLHRSWALQGGRGGIRMVRALELAGILSALALRWGDRAGILQNGPGSGSFLPPARGRYQLPRIVAALMDPGAGSLTESLCSLLNRTKRLVRERSRIFLVAGFQLSGAQEESTRRALARLAGLHALVPVWVTDAEEGDFGGSWPLPLEAPETGVVPHLPGGIPETSLREALRGEESRISEMLGSMGLRPWRFDVAASLLPTLRELLARDRWAGGTRV